MFNFLCLFQLTAATLFATDSGEIARMTHLGSWLSFHLPHLVSLGDTTQPESGNLEFDTFIFESKLSSLYRHPEDAGHHISLMEEFAKLRHPNHLQNVFSIVSKNWTQKIISIQNELSKKRINLDIEILERIRERVREGQGDILVPPPIVAHTIQLDLSLRMFSVTRATTEEEYTIAVGRLADFLSILRVNYSFDFIANSIDFHIYRLRDQLPPDTLHE